MVYNHFAKLTLVFLLSTGFYAEAGPYLNGCDGSPGASCRYGNTAARTSPPTILGLANTSTEIECFEAELVDPETGADGWFSAGVCFTFFGDDMRPDAEKEPPRNPTKKCGSIINVDRLSVGEVVRLHGTDDTLYYFSDRVVGRSKDYKFSLPIIDIGFTEIPNITVTASWLGQTTSQNFLSSEITTDTKFDFSWDGRDQNGDLIEGPTVITVESVHTYPDRTSTPLI